MTRLDSLLDSIQPVRDRLISHPVYASISTPGALRTFMEFHVYAVWDFMTLLKALQRDLTCVAIRWVPSPDPEACRLVNEIVLAEESDEDGSGGHASHFELYLEAMKQVGADLRSIETFLKLLRQGHSVDEALDQAKAPRAAAEFVRVTFQFVESGSTPAIASAFTLGREELIPDLFRQIVGQIESYEPGKLSRFRHYLDRHVHLDEEIHGPMALRMLSTTCGDNPSRWRDARYAAEVALKARLALWDGMLEAIRVEVGTA